MKKIMSTILILGSCVAAQASGATITSLDKEGNAHEYTAEALAGDYGGTFDAKALEEYQVYADETGGKMSFCPKFEDLPVVLDLVLETILSSEESMIDVALAIDVTGSMSDEIREVKENLAVLLDNIRLEQAERNIKVSLLVYKDLNQSDEFVTQLVQDLTSDLDLLDVNIQSIEVGGGGDHREAILDALEDSAAKVSWRSGAAKSIVLIGDAPGHKSSKKSGAEESEVLEMLSEELGIVVHPMLVANLAPGALPVDLPVFETSLVDTPEVTFPSLVIELTEK